MKIASNLLLSTVVALLVGVQPATADWPLQNLIPLGKKQEEKPAKAAEKSTVKWEPLVRLEAGVKKLGDGTKKFFTDTAETLRLKKPAAKRKPTSRYRPWSSYSKARKQEEKKSWLDSLFRREEPEPIQSMKDFVGLERPSP